MALNNSIKNELEERDHISIEEQRNIFIEAGAGAGKSTSLVSRTYYTLAFSVEAKRIREDIIRNKQTKQGVLNRLNDFTGCSNKEIIFRKKLINDIDKIIANELEEITAKDIYAITFTNKATEELRAKIVDSLKNKEDCLDDEIERKAIILSDIDNIHISTIHKFCEDILKENAIQAGLSPNFTPVIDEEEAEIRDRVIKNFFKKFQNWNDFEQFDSTNLSRRAIKAGIISVFDSLLSVADRIAKDQIFQCHKTHGNGLNEKRNAIKKLLEAVDEFIEENPNEKKHTLFSAAAIIKNRGYEYNQSGESRKDVIEKLMSVSASDWKKEQDKKSPMVSVTSKNDALKQDAVTLFIPLIDDVIQKGNIVDIAIAKKYIDYGYDLYQSYLNDRDNDVEKITSNDLVYKAYKLLNERADVLNKVRNKIKRLFIDEYQDTDSLQYKIASLIADNRTNCLYVVGDPKQSIYRFRGAEPDVFFETKQEFENDKNGHATFNLNINFRSNSKIIEWVNTRYQALDLIDPNIKYVYTPMLHHPRNEIQNADYLDDKKLIGFYRFGKVDENSIKDLIIYLKDNYLVRELIEDPANKDNKISNYREIKYKDIMVLMENHAAMPSFVEVFTRNNIPTKVSGESDFYNSLAVRSFVALYEAILVDNDSSLAQLEAVYFNLAPSLYKDKNCKESEKITKGLLNDLREKTKDMNAYGKTVYLVDHLSFLMKEKHIYQDFEVNFASSKLSQMVETIFSKDFYNGEELINQFNAFIEKSVERESLIQSEIDAVELINLHKAKGLEAPIVIWVSTKTSDRNEDNIGNAYKNKILYPSIITNLAKDNNVYIKELQQLKDEEDYEMARKEYVAVTRPGEAFIFADTSDNTSMFHSDKRNYNLENDDVREILLPSMEVEDDDSFAKNILSALEESEDETGESKEKVEEEEIIVPDFNFELEENAQEDVPVYQGEKECRLESGSNSIRSESPSSKENKTSSLREKLRKEADEDISNSNRPKSNNVGTILHRALQLLIRDRLSPVEAVETAMSENSDLVCSYEIEEKFYVACVTTFEKWFNDKYSKDGYELFPEFGFSYFDKTANVINNGSIDLLMKQGDNFIVIDYKSDESEYIKDDAVFEETLKEKYQPQLESYEQVVKDLFTVKSIKKLIIYFRRYDDTSETIDVCCYEIK